MMAEITLCVILIALIIAVTLCFFLREHRTNKPVVLGQQFANAMAKEQERLKNNAQASSQMPPNSYSRHKGEWGLLNPRQVELDQVLRELCSSYGTKPPYDQIKFRATVSFAENYTLIEFAHRAAIFALRSKDVEILKDGLTSITMIEAERTDFRDILVALALLHHTASRIGMDTSLAFSAAAKSAESGTSRLISRFIDPSSSDQCLQDSWGYSEVDTDSGIGFVDWGHKTYQPNTNLLQKAMLIASAFEIDSYFIEYIELATELPPVWLESPENPDVKRLLEKTSGGVTVRCRLEENKHPDPFSQQFTLFMLELDSPDTAQVLLRTSRKKKPKNFSMLGFAGGRLFALLIARSVMAETESYETSDSLERFAEPINCIIQQ